MNIAGVIALVGLSALGAAASVVALLVLGARALIHAAIHGPGSDPNAGTSA